MKLDSFETEITNILYCDVENSSLFHIFYRNIFIINMEFILNYMFRKF